MITNIFCHIILYMAPTVIDCSNIYFYKIASLNSSIDEIYIGFTTNMENKKSYHKRIYNNKSSKFYNSSLNSYIRKNGGFNNFDLFLIEKASFNDLYEVKQRLIELINEHEATLTNNKTDKKEITINEKPILNNYEHLQIINDNKLNKYMHLIKFNQ